MAQLNLSVPEGLKNQIEAAVAGGAYASASDYLRDLVRRDQQRLIDLAELQAMIDDGLASGIDPRDPSEIIESIIADARLNA